MGYFSQRKKRARENLFMLFSLVVLFFIYLILFFEIGTEDFLINLRNCLLHIYFFNLALLLYIAVHQKYLYLCFCTILLILGYTGITSEARLFFNYSNPTANELQVNYKKGQQDYALADRVIQEKILNKGKIFLSPNVECPFEVIHQGEQDYTLIAVDFSKVSAHEKEIALHNLQKYVLMQNNPVIAYGDFGMPAWSKDFQKFLQQTDLSVKNKVIFSDGKDNFKFWFVPTINVLAFKHTGLKSIENYGKSFRFNLNI